MDMPTKLSDAIYATVISKLKSSSVIRDASALQVLMCALTKIKNVSRLKIVDGKKYEVKPGCVSISINSYADTLKLSRRVLSNYLDLFSNEGLLTYESSREFGTILNFNSALEDAHGSDSDSSKVPSSIFNRESSPLSAEQGSKAGSVEMARVKVCEPLSAEQGSAVKKGESTFNAEQGSASGNLELARVEVGGTVLDCTRVCPLTENPKVFYYYSSYPRTTYSDNKNNNKKINARAHVRVRYDRTEEESSGRSDTANATVIHSAESVPASRCRGKSIACEGEVISAQSGLTTAPATSAEHGQPEALPFVGKRLGAAGRLKQQRQSNLPITTSDPQPEYATYKRTTKKDNPNVVYGPETYEQRIAAALIEVIKTEIPDSPFIARTTPAKWAHSIHGIIGTEKGCDNRNPEEILALLEFIKLHDRWSIKTILGPNKFRAQIDRLLINYRADKQKRKTVATAATSQASAAQLSDTVARLARLQAMHESKVSSLQCNDTPDLVCPELGF